MEDFKKLDSLTLTKLTMAILKAASVAIASLEDRSLILAKQLKKNDIPKNLTKLATTAFNRRLSVNTLRDRGDDTKALNFPLADFDKVAELRGCLTLQKKASVALSGIFKFLIIKKSPETILKKAFLQVLNKEIKEQPEKMLKKLASTLLKVSSDFLALLHEVRELSAILLSITKKASKAISEDIKTGRLLATVYLNTYKNLFTGKVPEEALVKNAAYAVLPNNYTVLIVEKAIKQSDLVNLKKELLLIKKKAAAILIQESQELLTNIKRGTITKLAGITKVVRDAAINSVTIPHLLAGELLLGAIDTTDSYAKKISPLFSLTYSVSPSAAITSNLINNAKYDDTANRLIDILSDKLFANYRVQDIEKAVNASISLHPEYVSPRFKEYLKVSVTNKLLAGNRTNTATQAALSLMIKRLAEGDKIRGLNSILQQILKMPSVKGSEIGAADVLPSIGKVDANKTLSKRLIPVNDITKSVLEFKDLYIDFITAKETHDLELAKLRLKSVELMLDLRKAVYNAVLLNKLKHAASSVPLAGLSRKTRKGMKASDIQGLTTHNLNALRKAVLKLLLNKSMEDIINYAKTYNIHAKPSNSNKKGS